MELTINKKSYSFAFGTKFIRELDKKFPFEREGMKFGIGLAARVLPELQSGNVATLSDILFIANQTEENKLTTDDIDIFIDEAADIEQIFNDVLKAISESNAGKLATKTFNKNLKAK